MQTEPDKMPAITTSKLAVASLILGCLSIFCGLFTGFPAALCGVIALIRLGKNTALKGTSLAIIGICLGGFSLVTTGILAALFIPAVSSATEKAQRMQAMADGRQLGVLLFTYANDHDGAYPERLEDLVEAEYLQDYRLLYQSGTQELRWEYTPGLTTSSPPKTLVLKSLPSEDFKGYIEIRLDTSSRWIRGIY